jgi:GDP-mannose 6-dehydrogenase
MRVSIFGLGYVGAVSGACLARAGHAVLGVDTNPEKVRMLADGISPVIEEGIVELVRDVTKSGRLRATTDAAQAVAETDVSLVSVGTPSAPNGSLSTAAVESVTREIGAALRRKSGPHTVIYRSTMLPGTTEDKLLPLLSEASGRKRGNGLDVVYNPEFLREGTSIKDFEQPPYTIAGGESETGLKATEEMYRTINAPFVKTSWRVAESVKYMSNVFHAVKISFANEVGALLNAAGVDARAAAEIFCMDTTLNISRAYLRPGYAFGGSCLPKDLRAMLSLGKANDLDLPMLSHVLDSNRRHVERAFAMIAAEGRRRIALFGLAFKGGTDDLRESPLVTLAELLIGKGYELKIYDPFVHAARLIGSNRDFIEREIPHFERMMQPDAKAALKDAEAVVIGHVQAADVPAILAHDPAAPIIDLQGVKRIEEARRGAKYRGICW